MAINNAGTIWDIWVRSNGNIYSCNVSPISGYNPFDVKRTDKLLEKLKIL